MDIVFAGSLATDRALVGNDRDYYSSGRGIGTWYAARVLHESAADSSTHEEISFHLGWSTATDQRGAFVEHLKE
jgi:hypothetical protein